MTRLIALAFLICVMPAHATMLRAQELDQPQANPGRPTVSTPATLTPVGYLQFETGFTGAIHSPEFTSSHSLNEVTKLSITPRVELLASTQPIAHFTTEGISASRVADVFLGAQGVLHQGQGAKPTLAVSYFRRVYEGSAPDIDIGSPINSFIVLASADLKGFHYDANAFFAELVQEPVRRSQFGQSLTISHALPGNFTLSGEVWHFTQPFLRSNAVGNLWGLSYTARKTLVFDVGVNHGFTGTSTRWEIFAGFTYLLPRQLWRTRGNERGRNGRR